MRHSTSALLLLTASVVQVWAREFDCSKFRLNDYEFDLSPLSGVHSFEESTQTPPTVTKTKYQLSLCSPLPAPSTDLPSSDVCPSGTRLCMSTFTTREGLEDRLLSVVPVVGKLEGDQSGGELEARPIKVEGVDEKERWILEIGGGKYNGVDQLARFEMVCNRNAKETVPTVKEYHSKRGVLDLEWTTFAACPLSRDDPPRETPPPEGEKKPDEGDEKKSRSGMGFFGWFFTLLLLGLIGYFILGSYHNYTQYGATGWDMIPHRDLWRDLPFVVSDLFKSRGGSRSGYSSLG